MLLGLSAVVDTDTTAVVNAYYSEVRSTFEYLRIATAPTIREITVLPRQANLVLSKSIPLLFARWLHTRLPSYIPNCELVRPRVASHATDGHT